MRKKVFSWLVVLTLIVSIFPASAFADDATVDKEKNIITVEDYSIENEDNFKEEDSASEKQGSLINDDDSLKEEIEKNDSSESNIDEEIDTEVKDNSEEDLLPEKAKSEEEKIESEEPKLFAGYTTGDDYPADLKAARLDALIDPWRFYNRECTSFVAWCLNSRNGVGFHNTYGGVTWGNASNWGNAARSLGITVDNNPAVGSVAWEVSGQYGHVAWVTSVNGEYFTTDEYNWNYDGAYHTRSRHKSSVSGFIHIADMSPYVEPNRIRPDGSVSGISDGTYSIASRLNTNMRLDVASAGTSNGTNLWLHERNDSPAQQFRITKQPDGKTYRMQAFCNNLYIDNGGSNANGFNTHMWEWASTGAQMWYIIDAGDGWYSFVNHDSGLVLDVAGGSAANGVNIQQYSSNGTDAQKFRLFPLTSVSNISDGTYSIVSKLNTNMRLDVASAGTSNGTNLWLHERNDSPAQQFRITRQSDGKTYRMQAVCNNLYIDNGGSNANGFNTHMWEWASTGAQMWYIIDAGDGWYSFVNHDSGLLLDVAGGSTANGANIQQHSSNGTDAQKWKFVSVEYKITYNANGGSGAPSAQIKKHEETMKLSSSKPTRSGYTFLGWAESASATTATYQPGASYTKDSDVTLYAVWQQNHVHSLTKTNAKAATCTATGNSAYWTCSGCGKYFSDADGKNEITKDSWVIPAKGHTVVIDKAVAATCTKAGKTEGSHCSVCNTVIDAQKTVKAIGHDFSGNALHCRNGCGTKNPDYVAPAGEKINISNWTVTGIKNLTYTGKVRKQANILVSYDGEYADISVKYKNNVNVGTATVTIIGTGDYTGTIVKTFKITQAANPLKIKVTSKTYTRTKLTRNTTFKIGATKGQGKVAYSLNSAAKNAGIKVTSKGQVKIPKKCKKGTYKITVKAAGNKNYKAGKKTVTIRVK